MLSRSYSPALKLFQNRLRSFSVSFQSNICGVTQGSTLGPLLFVLDTLSPGSILRTDNICLIPQLIQLNSTLFIMNLLQSRLIEVVLVRESDPLNSKHVNEKSPIDRKRPCRAGLIWGTLLLMAGQVKDRKKGHGIEVRSKRGEERTKPWSLDRQFLFGCT